MEAVLQSVVDRTAQDEEVGHLQHQRHDSPSQERRITLSQIRTLRVTP